MKMGNGMEWNGMERTTEVITVESLGNGFTTTGAKLLTRQEQSQEHPHGKDAAAPVQDLGV
jgi:hypothetical protein